MRTITCVYLTQKNVWNGIVYLTEELNFSKNIKHACRFYLLKESMGSSLKNRDKITINSGSKVLCYKNNRIELVSRQFLNNDDYLYTDLMIQANDENCFFDYGVSLKFITTDGRILVNKKNSLDILEIADSESSSFEILTANSCNIIQEHDWDNRIEITGNLKDETSKERAIARLRDNSLDERTTKNQLIIVVFLALILFVISYHNWK